MLYPNYCAYYADQWLLSYAKLNLDYAVRTSGKSHHQIKKLFLLLTLTKTLNEFSSLVYRLRKPLKIISFPFQQSLINQGHRQRESSPRPHHQAWHMLHADVLLTLFHSTPSASTKIHEYDKKGERKTEKQYH